MAPDPNEELEWELLDARKALREIREICGLSRIAPLTASGYAEIIEKVRTYAKAYQQLDKELMDI